MFKVLLSHTQYVARISEEHIAALDILCHILILALLEVLQFLLVICLNPACLMQVNRLPAALGIVLVLQAILDNLKLDDDLLNIPLFMADYTDQLIGFAMEQKKTSISL